jgi:hypothetical protein
MYNTSLTPLSKDEAKLRLRACANRQIAYYQRAIRRRCNRQERCQPSDCTSVSTRPSKLSRMTYQMYIRC